MHGSRLTWEELPAALHAWVARVLGGPVVHAASQPGGFSPGTADRVVTVHGRRAFVKAVSPAQNPDTPSLHRREVGVLRTLADLAVVPRLLDSYDDGCWVALVVEDVDGRHPHLPWTAEELRRTLETLADLGKVPAPPSWPALEEELVAEMGCWGRVRDDGMSGLDPWVVDRLRTLHDLALRTLPRLAGRAVVHSDMRADNLLVQPDGRVRPVDWPWASQGAPWFDAVSLLLDVRWSGGLDVRPHLPVVRSLGATDEDILGLLAGLTGFLTHASGRPPAPGLPTLRRFQAEQAAAGVVLLRELWPA
ncbi:phosphotransferase family protein [Ornithinimicrobium cerasi]|uniref:phosphotransferase family protein n=1 Tax=Ornithinimicrobium cerasi TaxID=2248773 RepID=UPI000EFDC6AE|nr:aminoglycoside phosphotransferase family protein [Ornithinimicrobium cerasi]